MYFFCIATLQIRYERLADEVRIGDYFLRLLLNETDEEATPIHSPYVLFALYILFDSDIEMKLIVFILFFSFFPSPISFDRK